MANGNIKGITVEIGADTTKLGAALRDVNSESIGLQRELKQVERLLRFDPGNTELIAQQQEILAQNIDSTSRKLETLRSVQSQVERQFASGEIGADQYRAFQREIADTEASLNGLRRRLSDIDDSRSGVDGLSNSFKSIAKSAASAGKEIGTALGAAGAAGAAAVGGLVTGMQETNEQLGMLKVQADNAGVSLEGIDTARSAFASVGQDINQTTEAMGNLIQAGFNTSDSINEISTSLAGAVVKYGETFNVEGLAESITTTTQLGEVTGQLMDLLEKEGINVDDFNAKMQSMGSEQERANYISQLLADQGLSSMYDKYVEMNPETVANADAQLKLQESLAELATVMSPLVTKVTEIVTAFVNWANENPQLASTVAAIGGVVATVVGVFAALSPIVSVISNLLPILKIAFAALTGPIGLVIAAITAAIAIGVALYKNWDEVSKYAKIAWDGIKSAISTAWDAIKSVTSTVWNAIKSFLNTLWNGIKTVAITIWNGLKTYFTTLLNVYKTLFTTIWNAIKSVTTTVFNAIKSFLITIWNGIKTSVSAVVNGIKTVITTVWNGIKTVTSTIFNAVKRVITTAWNNIKSATSSIVNGIKTTVTSIFNNMKSAVSTAMNNVKTTISKIWNNVMSFFKGIDLTTIGKNIIEGLINGIKGMATKVVDSVKSVVNGAIDGAKKLLGIHSPSRVFRQIGVWTVQGFANGISETQSTAEKAMQTVGTSTIAVLNDYADQRRSLQSELNEDIKKVNSDTEEKIYKIQANAAAKKRKLTTDENKQILKLKKEAAAKIETLKKTHSANLIKLEAEENKKYLETIQSFIDDKKSLEQLSLIDEAFIWEQSIKLFEEGSDERIKAQQKYRDALEAVNNEILSINEKYQSEMQTINDNLAKQEEELTATYTDALSKRYDSLISFADTFDAFTVEVESSGTDLLNNLQSQVDGFKMWQDEFAKLSSKNIDADLLAEISQLGVKALPELIALNQLTEEQLTQYSALYKEKSELAREQAESELAGMKEDVATQIEELRKTANEQLSNLQFEWKNAIVAITSTTSTELSTLEQIGKDAGQGLLDGLSSMQSSLIDTAQQIANAIRQTIQSALDIHSPSRVMRGFGVNVGEGLVIGMDEMINKVSQSSARLANAVANVHGSLSNSRMKTQSINRSSASYSNNIDKSRNFQPTVNIYTNDSGDKAMNRVLRRLAFEF